MKQAILLTLLVIATVFVIAPSDLKSCGPFFRTAVFSLKRGASMAGDSYEKGQLGVVLPSFDRKNLWIAYRYFSGVPLTPDEVAALYPEAEKEQPRAIQVWMEARKSGGAAEIKEVDPDRRISKDGSYDSFVNCGDDAFRTAAATLTKRAAAWGPGSPNLKEWIAGQDQVFLNCSGPKSIPAAAAGKDALLVADRQYQIAAANFYAGDWVEARKAFDEVAANASSPWRARVPYLKARVSIREATIGGNKEAMVRAEGELAAIKEDKLSGYVAAYARPGDRLRELSNMLLKPEPGPVVVQTVTDFVFLYDKFRDGQIGKGEDLAAQSELIDWIDTIQGQVNRHAVEKWRSTQKLPWLAAALSSAKADDSSTPELIAAVGRIGGESAAYSTLNYYAAKLQIQKGDVIASRERIETALKQALPGSSRNLFLQARFSVISDWPEFLKYAPRVPAGETFAEVEVETDWKDGALLDDDSVAVLNRAVPLSLWIEASKSPALPAGVRREIVTAAWTRAILLGKTTEARTLAGMVKLQRPELAGVMNSYMAAAPEATQFTAVYSMLRTPGFSPWIVSGFGRDGKLSDLSDFRDNWWHSLELTSESAKFLSDADRKEGAADWKTLSTSGSNGANYLAAETVKYVKANPADPRAAEALALAVRATHFSTTNDDTGSYSKQAFDLLHSKYPDTTFAKNTKYWYK